MWVATVLNLDWPQGTTGMQKAQLIALLNQVQAVGVNAVFFQVRAEADAFYTSTMR